MATLPNPPCRNSPLELMAFRLNSQFKLAEAAFNVEQFVGIELRLLAGVCNSGAA